MRRMNQGLGFFESFYLFKSAKSIIFDSMNIQAYLDRIQFSGPIKPDLQTLQALQHQHLLTVPFENLDIHLNRPIILEPSRFFTKIIEHKRGGFCYELNGLFSLLLEEIGFEVKKISARVHNTAKQAFGEEFDHLALLVSIDEETYLADVGFGEFVFQPLRFELDLEQKDPRGKFMIQEMAPPYFLISNWTKEGWHPGYKFSTIARDLKEFEGMCHYQQTDPDSHFTSKRMISIPIPDGRITLSGNTLKKTVEGEMVWEKEIKNEKEFEAYLQKYFGIENINLKLD